MKISYSDILFEVRFRGLLIVPSLSAYRELEELALDLNDVKDVLENGRETSSPRKPSVVEKIVRRDGKALRAVVVRDFNGFLSQDVFVVTHVSIHAWNEKMLKVEG
ncbi:MAG: hypothetical protein AABW54_00660 [Candidatus Micrarchaeota archaeon]